MTMDGYKKVRIVCIQIAQFASTNIAAALIASFNWNDDLKEIQGEIRWLMRNVFRTHR